MAGRGNREQPDIVPKPASPPGPSDCTVVRVYQPDGVDLDGLAHILLDLLDNRAPVSDDLPFAGRRAMNVSDRLTTGGRVEER
jgi:hypothetical protein